MLLLLVFLLILLFRFFELTVEALVDVESLDDALLLLLLLLLLMFVVLTIGLVDGVDVVAANTVWKRNIRSVRARAKRERAILEGRTEMWKKRKRKNENLTKNSKYDLTIDKSNEKAHFMVGVCVFCLSNEAKAVVF